MKNVNNKNNEDQKIVIRDAMDDVMDNVMANSCEYLKEYIAELGLSYDSPFDEENKKSKSIIDVINMTLTDCKNADSVLDDSYKAESPFSAVLPYAQNMLRMLYAEDSATAYEASKQNGLNYAEVVFPYDALYEEVRQHEAPETLVKFHEVCGRVNGWRAFFSYGSFVDGEYVRGDVVNFVDGVSEDESLYTHKSVNGEYELFIKNGIVFIVQHIMDTEECPGEMDGKFFLRSGSSYDFTKIINKFQKLEQEGIEVKDKLEFLLGSEARRRGAINLKGELASGDGIYAVSRKGKFAGKTVKICDVDEVTADSVKGNKDASNYRKLFTGKIVVDKVLFTTIKSGGSDINSSVLLCRKA